MTEVDPDLLARYEVLPADRRSFLYTRRMRQAQHLEQELAEARANLAAIREVESRLRGWVPFDYDDREANLLPEVGEMVWVHDQSYDGVTIGHLDRSRNGHPWWEVLGRGDDCHVTHWMPLVRPEAPVD